MTDTLIAYLAAILADGDYTNDWLTHLPHIIRPYVLFVGYLVSLFVS